MQRRNDIDYRIKHLVLRETLTAPRMIASGQSGSVESYCYTGNNTHLMALADADVNKRIAVKSFTTSVNKYEIRNINHLNAVTLQAGFYPKQLPIFLDDHSVHIAYEFVTYDNQHAANLEQFLLEVVNNIFIEPDAPTLEGFKHALRDFTAAIVQLQDKVHEAGLLHLDTALRNFLVDRPRCFNKKLLFNARITDFGLSRKLKPDGSAMPVPQKGMIPLRRYNQDVFTFRKISYGNQILEVRDYTIHTDIFSRKATIIEMIGLLLGKNELEVLRLDRNNIKPTPEEIYQQRAGMTDVAILNAYVSNLEYYLAQHPDQERANLAQEFLNSFKNYLTTMPPRNNHTVAQIRAHDLQSFKQALDAYTATLTNDFTAEQMIANIIPSLKPNKPGFFFESKPINKPAVAPSELIFDGYEADLKLEPASTVTHPETDDDIETENHDPFEIKPHRF